MPERMQFIAEGVVTKYNKEFNSGKMKELEKQITKLEQDMDKYAEMLLDAPPSTRSHIYKKIETADLQ